MNILLDLDGTLSDPRVGMVESIKYALSGLGFPCPGDRELERYIGPPIQETFAVLLDTADPQRIDSAIARYRERFSVTGLFENTVYPGIPEALRALKGAGACLYVATSKPKVFADRIIEHFNLGQFFNAVHGSELDGTRAQKGEVIAHLMRTHGLPPGSSVMVGDRLHDVVGAKENGLFSIGVLWGFGSREELVTAGAGALCDAPASLARVLSSSFMPVDPVELVPVESATHRESARALLLEYLRWVGGVAQSSYGLSFDIEAMARSDIEDRTKFFPPTGRFYLVRHDGSFVGVGCLKRLAAGVAEIQRMYVQPQVRGIGAGRAVVRRLIDDAQALGYGKVRLESLRALSAAHALYRSVGFVECEPYFDNSMQAYQAAEALARYRDSAVFMELSLPARASTMVEQR